MVLKHFVQMDCISAALSTGAAVALLSAAGIAPALAGGYTTSVTDTVKLDVQGAGYSQTRTGSAYSVGGNNVASSQLGGLGLSATSGASTDVTTSSAGFRSSAAPTIVNPGTAFSFSESAYVGDAVATPAFATSTTSGIQGTIAPTTSYGQVTTSTGGVAGNLAGTITSTGATHGTVTAGGSGTSATLQRTIDLTVFQ